MPTVLELKLDAASTGASVVINLMPTEHVVFERLDSLIAMPTTPLPSMTVGLPWADAGVPAVNRVFSNAWDSSSFTFSAVVLEMTYTDSSPEYKPSR